MNSLSSGELHVNMIENAFNVSNYVIRRYVETIDTSQRVNESSNHNASMHAPRSVLNVSDGEANETQRSMEEFDTFTLEEREFDDPGRVARVLAGDVIPALMVLGLSCNLLSFVVLRCDKSMKHTTRFLLQMLAFADFMFLLIYPAHNLFVGRNWFTTRCSSTTSLVCYNCLSPIVHVSSVWMVVMVTIERYIAICWSLHAARYLTMFRVRTAVVVVWIGSVIINIPNCIEFKSEFHETLGCVLVESGLIYRTREYQLWYGLIFRFFIFFLLPLSLLIMFNTCIIRSIRRSNEVTRHLTSGLVTDSRRASSAERRCTWMMIAVITVFIVCQLPSVLSAYFDYFDYINYFEIQIELLLSFFAISNLLLTLNSVANFFIYFLLGNRFRQILVTFFRCRQCTRSSFTN